MKNLIYAGLTTSTSVVANATIPFNVIDRKYNSSSSCSSIDLLGNAVVIKTNSRRPRYNGWVKITFSGATAGNAVFTVLFNGSQLPLAVATETITTPTTELRTICIPFSVLTNCCSTNTITVANTGTIGVTITNASILVVED